MSASEGTSGAILWSHMNMRPTYFDTERGNLREVAGIIDASDRDAGICVPMGTIEDQL